MPDEQNKSAPKSKGSAAITFPNQLGLDQRPPQNGIEFWQQGGSAWNCQKTVDWYGHFYLRQFAAQKGYQNEQQFFQAEGEEAQRLFKFGQDQGYSHHLVVMTGAQQIRETARNMAVAPQQYVADCAANPDAMKALQDSVAARDAQTEGHVKQLTETLGGGLPDWLKWLTTNPQGRMATMGGIGGVLGAVVGGAFGGWKGALTGGMLCTLLGVVGQYFFGDQTAGVFDHFTEMLGNKRGLATIQAEAQAAGLKDPEIEKAFRGEPPDEAKTQPAPSAAPAPGKPGTGTGSPGGEGVSPTKGYQGPGTPPGTPGPDNKLPDKKLPAPPPAPEPVQPVAEQPVGPSHGLPGVDTSLGRIAENISPAVGKTIGEPVLNAGSAALDVANAGKSNIAGSAGYVGDKVSGWWNAAAAALKGGSRQAALGVANRVQSAAHPLEKQQADTAQTRFRVAIKKRYEEMKTR